MLCSYDECSNFSKYCSNAVEVDALTDFIKTNVGDRWVKLVTVFTAQP